MTFNKFYLLACALFCCVALSETVQCGTYLSGCYNQVQHKFIIQGAKGSQPRSIHYVGYLYNGVSCSSNKNFLQTDLTTYITDCHNSTYTWVSMENCTVTKSITHTATLIDYNIAGKDFTCTKMPPTGKPVTVGDTNYECNYDYMTLWDALKSIVRYVDINDPFMWRFSTDTENYYMGFIYSSNEYSKISEEGCDGYVAPVNFKLDAGWYVAIAVVIVAAIAAFTYFRKQKKAQEEDNFVLMQTQA
ncbi:hypothetical protein WA158_002896 [Blastocystis sp. Blastoise]